LYAYMPNGSPASHLYGMSSLYVVLMIVTADTSTIGLW
jgi:hypothetical protein